MRGRLDDFRARVSQGRLVRYWTTAAELPGLVAISLNKTIKAYPAIGWIRANLLPSNDLVTENNFLLKTKEQLNEQLTALREAVEARLKTSDLAALDDKVHVFGTYNDNGFTKNWSCDIEWREVFSLIAPELLENPYDGLVQSSLADGLAKKCGIRSSSPKMDRDLFQTIKVQLM